MDLPAILKAVLAPQTDRSRQPLPDLQTGDKLTGKVLRLETDGRILIELGRTRVLAQAGFPVQKGQTLGLTVVKSGPQLHLQADLPAKQPEQVPATASNLVKVLGPPAAGHGRQALPELQPGTQITGRVVQLEDGGRIMIDLGGSRVRAQAGFAVQKGQSLTLTVVEKGPGMVLAADLSKAQHQADPASRVNTPPVWSKAERQALDRLIDRIVPRLEALKIAPALSRSITDAMHHLKSALAPLPMAKPVADIAARLRSSVEGHGALFEKQLADIETGNKPSRPDVVPMSSRDPVRPASDVFGSNLKPQLMRLKQFLAPGTETGAAMMKLDDKEIPLLRRSIDQLLQNVELQQEKAMLRSREGETVQIFTHSLPLDEERSAVRIRVYYPRKEGRPDSHAAHRIALLLDMDRLGPVRGDIAKVGDTLQIGFYVSSEDVRETFLTRLPEIESRLATHFDHVRLDVSVSRDKIEQFGDEDRPASDQGRIDIKA